MYFVISNSDGDTKIRQKTKEELTKELNEAEYGGCGFLDNLNETDTNYWGDNILIIKGEILIPKTVKVVEEYQI